jgi:hypothetical protein
MRWKILAAIIVLAISLSPLTAAHAIGDWQPLFEGDGGPCQISNCQTSCPIWFGWTVECCCWYSCPSGGTRVSQTGYSSNSSAGCL